MICPKCKKTIKDSAKICGYCGAKVAKAKPVEKVPDMPVIPEEKPVKIAEPVPAPHPVAPPPVIVQQAPQPVVTKVTTIRLNGTLASNRDMSDLYAQAIEAFQELLSREGCQMMRVDSQDERGALLGRTQMITIVWSGNSARIKTSYEAWPNYGLFGLVTSVSLR